MLDFFSRLGNSAFVTRLITIVAFVPMFFRYGYWCLKKLLRIIWFCIGWIMPARVMGNTIRLRRIGPLYWLVFPSGCTLLHHYGAITYVWEYVCYVLPEAITSRIEWVFDGGLITSILSRVMETPPPSDVVWYYFMLFVTFSTLVYLLVRLIDIEKIENIDRVLLISLLLGILGYVAWQGGLNEYLNQSAYLWERYPSVLLSWGLLSVWSCVLIYAIPSETYDYNLDDQSLVHVRGTTSKVMNGKNSIVVRRYNNFFRFAALGFAYDLESEQVEADKPYKEMKAIRYTFGLGVAIFFWSLWNREKAKQLRSSHSTSEKKKDDTNEEVTTHKRPGFIARMREARRKRKEKLKTEANTPVVSDSDTSSSDEGTQETSDNKPEVSEATSNEEVSVSEDKSPDDKKPPQTVEAESSPENEASTSDDDDEANEEGSKEKASA